MTDICKTCLVQPLGPCVMSALSEPALKMPEMRTAPVKELEEVSVRMENGAGGGGGGGG